MKFGIQKLATKYNTSKILNQKIFLNNFQRGPYDICCGFITNTTCLKDNQTECPLKGTIHGTISRPLYKDYKGLYEATLMIFNSKNEEIFCIDTPFLNKIKEDEKQKTVISLNKNDEEKFINPKGKEILIVEKKDKKEEE